MLNANRPSDQRSRQSDTAAAQSPVPESQTAVPPAHYESALTSVSGPQTARPLLATEQPTQPGITAEALLGVSSWSGLVEAYRCIGMTFTTDRDLYEQVRQDWDRERRKLIVSADRTTVGKPVEKSVAVNGTQFNLIGVVHAMQLAFKRGQFDSSYHNKIFEVIKRKPFWLVEHNLTSEFLPIPAPEMPDHNADGLGVRLLEGLRCMYVDPVRRFGHKLSLALRGKILSTHEILVAMTNLNMDAGLKIPAHIELIWRDRNGLPYTRDQRRSAYQAAFLQAWDPDRSYRVSASEKETAPCSPDARRERGVIVGAAHLNEIEYFLTNGIKDARVKARAEAAAGKLNQGVDVYQRYLRREEAMYRLTSMASSIGIGVGVAMLLTKVTSLL